MMAAALFLRKPLRGCRRSPGTVLRTLSWAGQAGVVDVRFPPVMVRAGWHCGGVKENETTAPGGVAALDDGHRYQAAVSKDPRFDGVFFIGVTSTGIYCRPSCPAITPKRENVRFYPHRGRGAAGGLPGLQALPS